MDLQSEYERGIQDGLANKYSDGGPTYYQGYRDGQSRRIEDGVYAATKASADAEAAPHGDGVLTLTDADTMCEVTVVAAHVFSVEDYTSHLRPGAQAKIQAVSGLHIYVAEAYTAVVAALRAELVAGRPITLSRGFKR